MPFDGNPKDYETKPDVFSVEGMIAWLETQDPATGYDYGSIDDCLICRYLRANGVEFRNVGGDHYTAPDYKRIPLPKLWNNVANGLYSLGEEWFPIARETSDKHTYGGALDRGRALTPSRTGA